MSVDRPKVDLVIGGFDPLSSTRISDINKNSNFDDPIKYMYVVSIVKLYISKLIKQVIVRLSVCMFVCTSMQGHTTRPNRLKFGG